MKKIVILLPLLFSLGACSLIPETDESETNQNNSSPTSDSFSSSENSSDNSSNNLSTSSSEVDPEQALLYDAFYNPSSDVKMKIIISNTHFEDICYYGSPYNPELHDIYTPCDVEVEVNGNKRTFNEVGIRIKGNTSREDSCNSFYAGYFNGQAHFKLAFNETFEDNTGYTPTTASKTLKNRRFGKAKKINLKWNRNYDEEFVKESYASYILEKEGLMAQKCNNIKVTFDVTDSGSYEYLYSVQEDINSEFLEQRLPASDSDGDLYKGGWVNSNALTLNNSSDYLIGVEDCTQNLFYVYDLKTNKKKSDKSSIKNLIDALSATDEGASQTALKNKLAQYVDVDYLLIFMAMEWVIGNPDSLRYHYNNTYFYFNSNNHLMYPIMYDNDRCFGIINGWNITPIRYPSTTKTTMNMDMSSLQISPLYWRTILNGNTDYPVVTDYRNRYFDYVEEYVNKYLNVDTFNDYKNTFHYKDNVDGGNMSFSEYASEMRTQMENCFQYEGR